MQVIELSMKDLRIVTDLIQDHIAWMEERNYSSDILQSYHIYRYGNSRTVLIGF